MGTLDGAARRTVFDALQLKPGEQFLLVTDEPKLEIARAVAAQAKEAGAEVTTYLMAESLRPITAATRLFDLMLRQADVTLYMLDARAEEKPFRGHMVQYGTRGRICMMPGITVDMMERLVDVDFGKMRTRTFALIDAIRDAEQVRVTNDQGTDITFSVKGRRWLADVGNLGEAHVHGNLPAGEGFTCPVEETFTGEVVVSSIDDKVGPGRMVFEKGRLVKYEGDGVSAIMELVGEDETGRIIGEFGIGTNEAARICENMLEAEKAYGTCHFAIGDSYELGMNASSHHYDALVEKVTIVADGKTLLEQGKFAI